MVEETLTPENPALPTEQTASVAAPLTVSAQYIKDLSFEAPTAPAIYRLIQKTPPDVKINVNVSSSRFEHNIHEVTLTIEANCTVGKDTAFMLELEYAGLFVVNASPEHIGPLLLIECPRLLFPFARGILADISRDGGFPPLMLNPVDFVAMYQAEIDTSKSE
jgi:preprotein translocase subunit SecB